MSMQSAQQAQRQEEDFARRGGNGAFPRRNWGGFKSNQPSWLDRFRDMPGNGGNSPDLDFDYPVEDRMMRLPRLPQPGGDLADYQTGGMTEDSPIGAQEPVGIYSGGDKFDRGRGIVKGGGDGIAGDRGDGIAGSWGDGIAGGFSPGFGNLESEQNSGPPGVNAMVGQPILSPKRAMPPAPPPTVQQPGIAPGLARSQPAPPATVPDFVRQGTLNYQANQQQAAAPATGMQPKQRPLKAWY